VAKHRSTGWFSDCERVQQCELEIGGYAVLGDFGFEQAGARVVFPAVDARIGEHAEPVARHMPTPYASCKMWWAIRTAEEFTPCRRKIPLANLCKDPEPVFPPPPDDQSMAERHVK